MIQIRKRRLLYSETLFAQTVDLRVFKRQRHVDVLDELTEVHHRVVGLDDGI